MTLSLSEIFGQKEGTTILVSVAFLLCLSITCLLHYIEVDLQVKLALV